jgi:hypothetical protein
LTAVADEMILKGFFCGADYRKKDIGLSRMMSGKWAYHGLMGIHAFI